MSVRPSLGLIAAALLLAACSRPEVSYYEVPREKDPELPPGASAAAAGPAPFAANGGGTATAEVPTAAGPGLVWQAPAAWKEKPATAMRKGSYAVAAGGEEADLSITAFPGDVGGELANVNRWRGQVQLPALDAAALPGSVTHLSHDGLQFTVVDLKGSSPQRIVGAIVPFSDGTWFFKLMGPDAAVAGARADFLAFLQTVKPSSGP